MMRNVSLLILVLLLPVATANAQSHRARESAPTKSLDPMNRPMNELGITGKDDTLCSDRWYSCSTYDRQQFDQKYPGQPLKDLLRFGEPEWPDRDRKTDEHFRDSPKYHDRLDKD